MRRYSKTQEENVRVDALVREWTRSRLLDEAQGAKLREEVQTTLRRTNDFLRVVLFLFTGLIIGASLLLVLEVLQIRDSRATAAVCGIGAIVCFGAAEFLVSRFCVYRFGVEEGLAVGGVVLVVVAGAQMASDVEAMSIQAISLLIGAIGGLALYVRFGFVYAGIAAIACTAMVPFPVVHSPIMQRLLAGTILTGVFVITRSEHRQHIDDFPGDDYNVLQASAWSGLYLVLNLHITYAQINSGWFYWTTYALIWLLPIVGLRTSIRNKQRLLMDVSAAMALTTLATNKSYLGLQHQTWDPLLFGLLLMGTATLIRRWLSSGPNRQRYGFTSARILDKDARLMTVVSTASAAFQPVTPSPLPVASQPNFRGGRSGGAGASSGF